MIKKVSAIILILAMAFTLTGCGVFSYWEGLTQSQAKKYIVEELEAKYGEEFVVLKTYKESGYGYTNLWADCAPKLDESLIFQVKVFPYGESSRDFQDMYIQSIVRREMKNNIDDVLSKYYVNYVSQVDIYGLISIYDSGICSANEASTKSYTELAPDNLSVISIILYEDEALNFDDMEEILSEVTPDFYKTNALINCYRVPKDILDECKENTNEIDLSNSVEYIVSARYPAHYFHYTGEDESLWLTQTNLCSCAYCIQKILVCK